MTEPGRGIRHRNKVREQGRYTKLGKKAKKPGMGTRNRFQILGHGI